MLHPILAQLNRQFTPTQWMFLLTAYELSPRDWIHRSAIYHAAAITEHKAATASLTKTLRDLGYIQTKYESSPTNPQAKFLHIRLTPDGRAVLRSAFQIGRLTATTAARP